MAVYILSQMLTMMAADLENCVAAFTIEAAKTATDCAILQEEFVSRSKMLLELKTSMQNAAKLLDMLESPAVLPDLTELLKTELAALKAMHQKVCDARRKIEGQQTMCKNVMRQLLAFLQVHHRPSEASVELKEVQGVCYHDFAPFDETLETLQKDNYLELLCVQAAHTVIPSADMMNLAKRMGQGLPA
jgi:hypothetical protein